MGNMVWSEQIQGILNLDLSREIRFRDDRSELFLNILGIKSGMTEVDVGCGPGILTRKLAKWVGQSSSIIGVDRDTNFINYARSKAGKEGLNNIMYYEGDALELPLKTGSVDACVAHTVIEHVPNREFLREQKRVCRSGGRVSVIYSRPDKFIRTEPELTPEIEQCENELIEKLFSEGDEVNNNYKVGKYWPDPVKLPCLFEELGFKNIQIDAYAIPIAVDDWRNSLEKKLLIVDGERQQLFESIDLGLKNGINKLSSQEIKELKHLINQRFDKRIEFINENKSIWDYTIMFFQVIC